MIEIDPLIVMTMGEVLVILFVIIVVMVALAMKRKTNDRKAVEELIERLKKNRATRRDKIRCMLNGKYHYQDEQLDQAVNDLSKIEKGFYQKFIDLYLGREHKALSKFDQKVEEITEPYFNLALPEVAGEAASEDESKDEIARLREANDKLKEELAVSMNTLGRMLSEYSNILGEETALPKEENGDESPSPVESLAEASDDSNDMDDVLSPVLMDTRSEAPQTEEVEAESPTEEPVEVSGDELLEIPDEIDEVTADSIDDLLAAEGQPSQPEIDPNQTPLEDIPDDFVATMQESVDEEKTEAVEETLQLNEASTVSDVDQETQNDSLPEDVMSELEQVASQIDDLVVETPEEEPAPKPPPEPEPEFDVDDIDALLAAAVEIPAEIEENPNPDDILDELQEAQDLGQSIEDMIDEAQNSDNPVVEQGKSGRTDE